MVIVDRNGAATNVCVGHFNARQMSSKLQMKIRSGIAGKIDAQSLSSCITTYTFQGSRKVRKRLHLNSQYKNKNASA